MLADEVHPGHPILSWICSVGSSPVLAAHIDAMNFYEKYVEMVRGSVGDHKENVGTAGPRAF